MTTFELSLVTCEYITVICYITTFELSLVIMHISRTTVSQDVKPDFLCSWPSLNSYLK